MEKRVKLDTTKVEFDGKGFKVIVSTEELLKKFKELQDSIPEKGKEKVGLRIVELLHDITQAGYTVDFGHDFRGMVRVGFFGGRAPLEVDEHHHLGVPHQSVKDLEKQIINCLAGFLDERGLLK